MIAAAVLDGFPIRTLAEALISQAKPERLELLLVASAAAGRPFPLEPDGSITILPALSDAHVSDLSADQRADLEAWSVGLDTAKDVQGVTSFIAERAFSLPVKNQDYNPRKLEAPKRIGVMTLRSMSSMAEEVDGDEL